MMNSFKQKVLLLLSAGLAFGYSFTPKRQWKIVKGVSKKWRDIDKKQLQKEIRNLYRSKLVEKKENSDGSVTIVLTNKGKLKSLTYRFQDIKISTPSWDGKWRVVIFDIPEKLRKGRDALREKLQEVGFHELQKSVFVLPYECKNEVDFIIEFFELRKYVRYGILETIDNDFHLRQIFNLK